MYKEEENVSFRFLLDLQGRIIAVEKCNMEEPLRLLEAVMGSGELDMEEELEEEQVEELVEERHR